MKKIYLSIAAITASMAVVLNANAYVANSSLDVGVTIVDSCSASTTPVYFGNVPSGNGATAAGTVDVSCTAGVGYTVALGVGNNDDTVTRRMTDGTNFLSYTLYDNVTAAAWGDGTFGGTVSGTGTTSFTVDATMTGAAVPTGPYSDVVAVTVTY